ncbi:MAG: gliding motility-associated C-terminal domain-containing protein, partial [Flavobacteriales bacterium]|nr:gliding motility-associated C-terminal domain-containing protein [Flavobacteriales bacterium]
SVMIIDANGCEIEGSISVPLITSPVASFLSRSKPEEFVNPDVQFDNESTNALTYEWHFGDGNVSYEEFPAHRYDTSGVFLVMLIAYNEPEYGCADTTFLYMEVDPMFTFYVPSGFTPDGDGLNDKWGPVGQGFEYESFNMKIFDRWGKLIWQSDNPNKFWDGTMRSSSKDVKQGMYVYVFTMKKFNTFEPKVIKGTVTLYRHN